MIGIFAATFREARLQLAHIGFRPDKRIANDVRVFHDEWKRRKIVFRQRRGAQVAVGNIDPFFSAELFARRASARDFDGNFLRRNATNDAADFAVVERNRFAHANSLEKFRQCNSDARRTDQLISLVVLRGPPGFERTRQHERIAATNPNRLGLGRNCPDTP
jgi:hypothetical protein